VTLAEWEALGEALGIDQVTLSTPDFFPPPFDIIEKEADSFDSYLSNGHRAYAHCKSGNQRRQAGKEEATRSEEAGSLFLYFFVFKGLDMGTGIQS
jgi:hypothetical protein